MFAFFGQILVQGNCHRCVKESFVAAAELLLLFSVYDDIEVFAFEIKIAVAEFIKLDFGKYGVQEIIEIRNKLRRKIILCLECSLIFVSILCFLRSGYMFSIFSMIPC